MKGYVICHSCGSEMVVDEVDYSADGIYQCDSCIYSQEVTNRLNIELNYEQEIIKRLSKE